MARLLKKFPPNIQMSDVQLEARDKLISLVEQGEIQLGQFMECPLCKFPDYHVAAESDRHGIGCEARLCLQCSVIYTTPHVATDDLPKFYDHIYSALNYGQDTPKHLFSTVQGENIYAYTVEFGPEIKKIVDIGAGSGDVIKYLSSMYPEAEVLGVDYNHHFVEGFEPGPNQKMLVGGVETLIELGGTYDLIILSHVLEHVVELDLFLEKVAQISHAKTLIYLKVPGIYGYLIDSKFYDLSFNKFHTLAHVYNFNLKSLREFLEKNGLVMLKGDERVRGVFQRRRTDEPSEVIRVKHLLETNLPALKEKFLERTQNYYSSPLARYTSPMKEVALSEYMLKTKKRENYQNKRIKEFEKMEEDFNKIKEKPVKYYLKKLYKKLKST